jgi:drug/metabolite transporter (DMT)-like permease
MMGIGPFCLYLIIRLITEISYKCKTGSFFKPDGKSRIYNEKTGIKWLTFLAILINGLTNVGYLIALTYAWNFAKKGGMNQGVISILVSFASVFNAITFYFVFGEKISKTQGLGVVTMLGCAACLALEAGTKKKELAGDDTHSEQFYAYIAIPVGLLGPILMSTKHLFIRKFKNKLGYSGLDQSIDSNVSEYFFVTFLLIPLYNDF